MPSFSDTNILVNANIDGIVCDLLYAKDTNFTGKKIYKNHDVCFVHKDTLEKLKLAVKIASKLEYKIKITDAFRPIEVQQVLWNVYPDENFVSNPTKLNEKLGHCRGTSIDVTLVDYKTGNELPMGTPVDYFGEKSYLSSIDMQKDELKNRMVLVGIMSAAGFETLETEWWHFNLPNMTNYPIIENGLEYVPMIEK